LELPKQVFASAKQRASPQNTKMNVFEDLIEELRDENLLEDTVIDLRKERNSASLAETAEPNVELARTASASNGLVADDVEGQIGDSNQSGPEQQDERDFYRKRAMDEISSLQMVEHVLSGIEREHMKTVPATYDDLEAKKALHKFLQVQGEPTTSEYAEAEFKLMHETEAWSSALSARDTKISVSNLRRFCENSRPILSSQALMALGRFYRNTSYSELSRAKFDLVMTRLFSRDSAGEKRRLLFGRAEMVGHIKTLYANWASIALYSTEDGSLKTRAVVAGFDERVAEAEAAQTFEQLITGSFFDKVHEFKEATGEMFFTPEIVAAAIESNTKIGNKFVDLISVEREKTNPDSVEQKYGYEYDQIISEAAGKTLHLVELLKSLPDSDAGTAPADDSKPVVESKPVSSERSEPRFSRDMFRVNKWLLAITIILVVVSGGLYFWADKVAPEGTIASTAKNFQVENAGLE